MNGLIIYEKKYGSTRQYAEWLGEEMGIPVTRAVETGPGEISEAEFLIVGTPVYYGKLRIKKWLQINAEALKGKSVYLFIVCGSKNKSEHEKIVADNIPAKVKDNIKVFFLRGRLIHSRLNFIDRIAMKLRVKAEKDPVVREQMGNDLDEVKRENLEEVLNEVSVKVVDS